MDRHEWERVGIAVAMIVATLVVAKIVDNRIRRRDLPPEVVTRYTILRRTIVATIVFIGVLSALLVIPQVRAIAGGILASSAVLGIVIGFAAQRTLGNFIAGLMIAFTQPVRIGDEIEVDDRSGVVEEIGLTYTWLRLRDNDRVVIPNEKLASQTIRNSTIRSTRSMAEVTAEVPLDADLRLVVDALREDGDEVLVSSLGESCTTIVVRRWATSDATLARDESDLRLAVLERLRTLGVYA
jgi:small-conductance mechanosensitive channel